VARVRRVFTVSRDHDSLRHVVGDGFDFETASDVLEHLAALADRHTQGVIAGDAPLLGACAGIISDLKQALLLYRTPYESFSGDEILFAWSEHAPLRADRLAELLRTTAQELAQVTCLLRSGAPGGRMV
jgi:hypothetical protein